VAAERELGRGGLGVGCRAAAYDRDVAVTRELLLRAVIVLVLVTVMVIVLVRVLVLLFMVVVCHGGPRP
jgi:hypothetical protein